MEGIAFKDAVVEKKGSDSGYSSISLGLVWTPANASNKGLTYTVSNPDVVDFRNNM